MLTACPNIPPCGHSGVLHDLVDLEFDPVCDVPGCGCGQPTEPRPVPADPDRPCEHLDFISRVDVVPLTDTDGGPVTAFVAEIRVQCAGCRERFRFTGAPVGFSGAHPTVEVDEATLNAPIRPSSADPNFGLGIPGFAVRQVIDPRA